MEKKHQEIARQITKFAHALAIHYNRGELSRDGYYRSLIGQAVSVGAKDSDKMHEYIREKFVPEIA